MLSIKCWGSNSSGQLGLEDDMNHGDQPNEMGDGLAAVDVGDVLGVLSVAAGGAHTCARLYEGRVKCWGKNNNGQLGLGDPENRGDEPMEMGDDLPFVRLFNDDW